MNIKPAENFPVDIYFLNDLSFSMKEDLENLRKLSNKIGKKLLIMPFVRFFISPFR